MEEKTIGYKMTDNVNKIVSLFQNKPFAKLEGEIRDKDLQAAATFLGEPIFVSKGRFKEYYFEENVLLDFSSVRNKYIERFNEAISSLDTKNLFTDGCGFKPHLYDIRLIAFYEHIDKEYKAFYPYNFNEWTESLCEDISDNYEDYIYGYDKDDECTTISLKIDEETIWFARTYTKEFVEKLRKNLGEIYEYNDESGLCYNGVDGINIDEQEGIIVFYTWDEDESINVRWDLYYSEIMEKDY